MNKKYILSKLEQNGDSIISFGAEDAAVTTDFSNKYIRAFMRTVNLKKIPGSAIRVWSWTHNTILDIPFRDITSIQSMASILNNKGPNDD